MEIDGHASRPSSHTSAAPRGVRACTVCRQAKMKCIGAENGQRACNRCEKSGLECVFEKHRRGRKPGSRLSEASKMLRLLEKGLNNVKMKQDPSVASSSHSPRLPDHHALPDPTGSLTDTPSRPDSADKDEGDEEDHDDAMIPTRVITREQRRTSFFRTILNDNSPTSLDKVANPSDPSGGLHQSFLPRAVAPPTGYQDPISLGILTESECADLFELVYLRLNLFINLLDPYLHNMDYVRSRCPFLFSALMAAGCRFFKGEHYPTVRQLAKQMAIRAFAEDWKSIEVCQAFACMTYWKDPEETKTWTYVGFACRLAVELGLNKFHLRAPSNETELQRRERRNRERTYLVLWVHDRSLSMQTGRQWMLPESPLVTNSHTWHMQDKSRRPEDVTVAAFVQLRRIGAEATDVFLNKYGVSQGEENYEVELQSCNAKLDRWSDHWGNEMKQAGGQEFQISMLSFFKLHIKLFLNTFGLQSSYQKLKRVRELSYLQAISVCYESALESLNIVSADFFTRFKMLPYCQDSVTVMTAYSAICLLWLLRRSELIRLLPHQSVQEKIYAAIDDSADAFRDALLPGQTPESASYHSRFLKCLLERDTKAYSQSCASSGGPEHHVLTDTCIHQETAPQLFATEGLNPFIQPMRSVFAVDDADRRGNIVNHEHAMNAYIYQPAEASADQIYWRNMHVELGMNCGFQDQSGTWQDERNST